ncbi:hypothetical protein THMIRHAM_16380 [Thiomicrorhabdus immobilis]|uniref:Uncharacterized protein n=1 Tax=Thiomicrorhabdus immobilis TaxID=2791037 RepID=A0ABM7MEK7_9GAMM|nr:hypothetical protein [Thiomicrorhabdus immobilis]BCN93853.1 hypothetical protein THMIRHAM_16380 [Thiomicrorhabdus immobilis]
MNTENSKPLQWIRLELVPLPNFESEYPTMLLWWNSDEGILQGENVEFIKHKLDAAIQQGSITLVSQGSIEITNPYQKPSELAAVLGQYFWVVPQPVAQPDFQSNQLDSEDNNSSTTDMPTILQ